MKLKIRAYTNQNVSVGAFDYPPYSHIECELDSKCLPIYAKAFDTWEIIEPEPEVIEVKDYKVGEVENRDDEKNIEQIEVKSDRKNPKKVGIKQS